MSILHLATISLTLIASLHVYHLILAYSVTKFWKTYLVVEESSRYTCEFLFSCKMLTSEEQVYVIEAYARIFTLIKLENIVRFERIHKSSSHWYNATNKKQRISAHWKPQPYLHSSSVDLIEQFTVSFNFFYIFTSNSLKWLPLAELHRMNISTVSGKLLYSIYFFTAHL